MKGTGTQRYSRVIRQVPKSSKTLRAQVRSRAGLENQHTIPLTWQGR